MNKHDVFSGTPRKQTRSIIMTRRIVQFGTCRFRYRMQSSVMTGYRQDKETVQ